MLAIGGNSLKNSRVTFLSLSFSIIHNAIIISHCCISWFVHNTPCFHRDARVDTRGRVACVYPPPTTTTAATLLRVSTRRAASTPRWWLWRDPRDFRERGRSNFLARINGTSWARPRRIRRRGPMDSARRRRLADSWRRSTSERTLLTLEALPRLAPTIRRCPLVSSPRRALVTPTSAAADTLRYSLWCFHSGSFRLLVYMYMCANARARVYVWLQSLTLCCLIPCRLYLFHSFCLPRVWHQLRELCIPFSLSRSHHIRFFVRFAGLLSTESTYVTKMITSWYLINILV